MVVLLAVTAGSAVLVFTGKQRTVRGIHSPLIMIETMQNS